MASDDMKRFLKMSKPWRRVALARDVLKQQAAGLLDTRFTAYAYLGTTPKNNWLGESPKTQLPSLTKGKRCAVCGIGALFKCAIERANDFKVGDLESLQHGDGDVPFVSGNDIVKYLDNMLGTFSKEHLNAIEDFYERSDVDSLHSDHDDRLRLIMENIIVNDGMFVENQPTPQFINGRWMTPTFTR